MTTLPGPSLSHRTLRNPETAVGKLPARFHRGSNTRPTVPSEDKTSTCFCPSRSGRRTSGGVVDARSPKGDFATGYDRCGRFDLLHQDAVAVGMDLVNATLFG